MALFYARRIEVKDQDANSYKNSNAGTASRWHAGVCDDTIYRPKFRRGHHLSLYTKRDCKYENAPLVCYQYRFLQCCHTTWQVSNSKVTELASICPFLITAVLATVFRIKLITDRVVCKALCLVIAIFRSCLSLRW